MLPVFKLCLLAICLVWPTILAAGLFDQSEVLEVRLSGPLKSTLKDTKQRDYEPFQLAVEGKVIDIRASVRGKSRARVCDFPPIRLDFKSSNSQQTVFEGQGKIKLVTHCRNNSKGTANVLEEYAAYRIFSILTDASYRTRLLHIRYEDTAGKLPKRASPNYGFLLEPSSQLKARTGGEWAQLPGIRISQVEKQHAALVFVFQYLIGNTDWSLVSAEGDKNCCHNGDLLEMDSRLFLIPYDFDLAGLVNAAYAKPDPSIRIRGVTTRRYRGYCIGSEAVLGAIRHVVSKKDEILDVLRSLPGYPEKDRNKSLTYLERFFEEAEDETGLSSAFEKQCLG